jgi:hypothetical protein
MHETSIVFRYGQVAAWCVTAALIVFCCLVIILAGRIEHSLVVNIRSDSISSHLSLTAEAITRLYSPPQGPPLSESEIQRITDLELGQLGVKLKGGELVYIKELSAPKITYIRTEIEGRAEAVFDIPQILEKLKSIEKYIEEANGEYRFVSRTSAGAAENGEEVGALIYSIPLKELGYKNIANMDILGGIISPIFAYILLFLAAVIVGSLVANSFISKLLTPARDVYNGLNRIVMGDFTFKFSSEDTLLSAYNSMVAHLNKSAQSLSDSTALEKQAEEELNQYRIQLDYKLLESAERSSEVIREAAKEIERYTSEKIILEDMVRKNIFATAASSIAYVYSKFWAGELAAVKSELRAARRVKAASADPLFMVQKITSMIAEADELHSLFSIKDGVEEFSIALFFEKCRRCILVFEKEGISININFSGDTGGVFFGYESFYIRTILFFIGYAAYSIFIRKTEKPEIVVNIGFLPETLRISIMDNCKDLAEESSLTENLFIDKSALLIHFYIDILKAYRGTLDITKLTRGLCYLFEFNSLGVGYEV